MPRKIPTTSCSYMDTPDRRVLDLSADGVPEIPVLGVNKSLKVRAGAVLHRHADVLEFTLCLRGSVKFDCNGKVCNLLPGEVFLTSPKDVHRLRTNTMGSMVRWIFFRPPKRGGTLPGLQPDETAWLVERLRSIPGHVFDGTDAIGRAFDGLFAAYDRFKPGLPERRVRMRTCALDLLMAFADAGHQPRRKDCGTELQGMVERMRRHPEADFDIDELVASTMLSPSTLVNRFKQLTGLPPHAFLLKCRIHRAAEELSRTAVSIGDLAMRLKFASAQHFATRFKRETGKTPQEWRTAYKKS